MDVAGWLKAIGLARYEQTFREQAIDMDVLPALDDAHLRELGVPLGDRLRLLKAIAGLQEASATIPSPQARGVDIPPAAASAPDGERRQVTVVFADLVGFTSLSNAVDAEEVHGLLGHFFERADRIVEAHGGHVDKHIGDCVMAVFGAPVAHGNDAERAVRAALAIRAAMPGLAAQIGRPVDVHVGIAGGQVVASSTGSTSHQEYTVTGETVNLAARLTEAARAGEILLSDHVRQQLPGRLAVDDAGQLAVKGFARPVAAWRLSGLRQGGEAAGPPLVGRTAQLGQCRALLGSGRESRRGHLVYIRGEAGIGKSRLVEEIRKEAAGLGYVCTTTLILDFGAGAGHEPLTNIVRGLLDIDVAADDRAVRAAVEQALEDGAVAPADAVFLYHLLAVLPPPSLGSHYEAMDVATRRDGGDRVVAALLRHAAARHPRLLVVEDLHWADPVFLAQLASLAAAVSECPAMLVMTSRVDGDPVDGAWRSAASHASLVTLDLAPLSGDDALALAGALTGAAGPLAERCVARAAGNPLFLEQLLRHTGESAEAGVPGSVQSLVQARLDRLEAVDRAVLKAASVLGQRFDVALLAILVEGSPEDSLERAAASFLIRRQGGDACLFSHALIRDGIYATLLKSQRRSLHRRAADWFVDRDPVLRAEHLDRAEAPDADAAYLAAATAQAAQSRQSSALRLVGRGLEIAASDEMRFALSCLQGDLLHDQGSMREAKQSYSAAAEAAGSERERCRAWIGLASVKRVTDDLDGAFADLARAEAAAGGQAHDRARIAFLRGNLLFPRGDIEGCLREHSSSLALAREAGSVETEAAALGGLGDAEYLRGHLISAHRNFRHCVELSRQHGLLRVEAANRPMAAISRWLAGDAQEGVLQDALEAVDAARSLFHLRAEMVAHHAVYLCSRALMDLDRAAASVERAIDIARTLGAMRFVAEGLAFRAELRRLAGRDAEAAADVGEALEIGRASGMAFIGPVILGTKARIAADPGLRRQAIAEAEALLAAGSPSHNHLLFRQDAIDACLAAGEWSEAARLARDLLVYAGAEPMPLSSFVAARGAALAAFGGGRRDGELHRHLAGLRDEGKRLGLLIALPEIQAALARFEGPAADAGGAAAGSTAAGPPR
ncbi:MAG: adenylate/guanylate cyclase domain-containing protein [Alphaproteobacteria bacterium]